MSIFDKDLVTKEIQIHEDCPDLENRLTFLGILPEGTDLRNYIKLDESLVVDPTNGNMYMIKDTRGFC